MRGLRYAWGQERLFQGVFTECLPFNLDDQVAEVPLDQVRGHMGRRRITPMLAPPEHVLYLLGPEVRDHVFAEEAEGVQHLRVLRRPDGAQQE